MFPHLQKIIRAVSEENTTKVAAQLTLLFTMTLSAIRFFEAGVHINAYIVRRCGLSAVRKLQNLNLESLNTPQLKGF